MEVDAFIADSAVVAEGKLYVQGAGWNILWANATPVRSSRIGLGVLIHVPFTETNQMHVFTVKIIDQDGNELPISDAPPNAETVDGKIYELKGQFNMGRPPNLTPGDEQIVPLAMNIDGLLLPAPTMYSVVIAIDGNEMKRLPMRIQMVDPQASSSPRF